MNPTVLVLTAQPNPINYTTALQNAACTPTPLVVPPTVSWWTAAADAAAAATQYDGLLLSGGWDVHPALYGQQIDGSRHISLERDRLELAYLHAFLLADKPVLGICRGLQLINIAFGGTLTQHVEGHNQIDDADRVHDVTLSRTNPYAVAVSNSLTTTLQVNSAHHQVIDTVGEGLAVWATANDGVIEGIAHTSLPLVGFQWHPERHLPTCQTVFDYFRKQMLGCV